MTSNVNIPGMFRLGGLDGDDIQILLPAELIADLTAARSAVNEAILTANRVTRQGRDGGYFEALQEALFKSGIQTVAEIEALGTRPWDDDCTDELGEIGAEEDMVEVVISNVAAVFEHGDDDQMLCEIEGDETHASYAIDADADIVLRLHPTSIEVTFPRSDKYGVPDISTDRGGRQYLRDLGFLVPSSVEVNSMDSGDDSPTQISVTCKVPRELLQPAPVCSDSSAERP